MQCQIWHEFWEYKTWSASSTETENAFRLPLPLFQFVSPHLFLEFIFNVV